MNKYLILLLFIPSLSWGGVDGNYLLKQCTQALNAENGISEDGWNSGFCYGFMHGFLSASNWRIELTKKPICLPEQNKGTNIMQMIRVIVSEMKKRPEILHIPAPAILIATLQDTFPCEEQKPWEKYQKQQ